MRLISMVTVIILMGGGSAISQNASLDMHIVIQQCAERFKGGEFSTRVQAVGCLNAGISTVYGNTPFNFGDIILEHEANNIRIASDADSKKTTQAEYAAQLPAEDMLFRAALLRRMQQQTDQAAERSRQANQDLQNSFRSAPTRTYSPAIQPYMLPPPLTFKPLTNGTNCTTIYFGNQAETHCQ